MTYIDIPRPHPGQRELLAHNGSAVIFCGRRWGKTQVGVYRLLQCATDAQAVGLYWWVGLSWRSASMKRAWRLLKFYVRKIWRALGYDAKRYIKETTRELILPNGSQIWMRTAENQDSLAGEGIRGVIIDEFTLMREVVWTEFIQATLADYQGWAWFMGIPKGEGWHAQLWRKAKDWRGWLSVQYSSYDNPTIKNLKAWLDEIKTQTPEAIFNQEYLAMILPDGGAVFRRLKDALLPERATIRRDPNREYVFGVDWGRHEDWTVITVWEVGTQRLVALDRFQGISWELQRGRIVSMYLEWQPHTIIAESNSMGESQIEALVNDGLPVIGFTTTQASKRDIIERLALNIERGEVKLLNDQTLIDEFTAFTMIKTRAGTTWTYSAPSGYHDDIVMSAAIGYTQAESIGLGAW